MLLAIDIGNTNVVFGIHSEGKWVAHWRIRTVRDKMPDEYGVLLSDLLRDQGIGLDDIQQVILSSVVPPLTGGFASCAGATSATLPWCSDRACGPA